MSSRPLYYMAPIQNAMFICINGILSNTRSQAWKQSFPPAQSVVCTIANPSVNMRRDCKAILDRPIHDYVNLYWATHTPMHYVLTVKERTLPQDNLVFFVCDSTDILQIPGVVTTDGNASSRETRFWLGQGALPFLDWDKIETRSAWSREYKRKKSAEVLVPDQVPRGLIRKVCVKSEQVRVVFNNFLESIRRLGVDMTGRPPVTVDESLYY